MPAQSDSLPTGLAVMRQKQEAVASLAVEGIDELLKFYSPKEQSFRRTISRWAIGPTTGKFSTASLMATGAIQRATQQFSQKFDSGKREKIDEICRGVLAKYRIPKNTYPAISSEAFGDFNPFTSAILLKEMLRQPEILDKIPLTFRLGLRIVLGYLITTLGCDLRLLNKIFGTRSIWSLPENHPMVLLRCVDCLLDLLAFIKANEPPNEWVERCFKPLSQRETSLLSESALVKLKARIRERVMWLNDYSLRYHFPKLVGSDRGKELLESLLDDLSGWARDAVEKEIGKHRGKERTEVDPSSLAGAMAMIAIASPSLTRVGVIEGLEILFAQSDGGGRWPVGRPFFYDEMGGGYHSVSIEIGYAALRAIKSLDEVQPRLSMDRTYDAFHDRLYTIYKWIEASRVTLTTEASTPLYAFDGKAPQKCRGWASDRSPGVGRIDSWMSAIVLDFICEDYALRKDYIQRLVLSRYQVTPYEHCKPRWKDIVDPDSGQAWSVKKTLTDKFLRKRAGENNVSLLLYGPPGTSKTSFVRALARARKASLLELSAGDFVQDGLELLENRARQIFRDLPHLENVVVLFDEMDPLIKARRFRLREAGGTIADYVIPGMLPKLQDLHDHCTRANMMFVIITNYRDTVDSAVVRKGRIDVDCLVLPYTKKGRIEQLRFLLTEALGRELVNSRGWKGLIRKISEKSGLMVYRDLEQLAMAVVKKYREGWNERVENMAEAAEVREALGLRSVRLESYRREERPDGGWELLCVLHRLLDLRVPRAEVMNDMKTQRKLFGKLARRLSRGAHRSELVEQASEVALQWSVERVIVP